MRGHDWLALFTPSERPIAPSRVSLRLGSPPSLSAGCDRCPTPARPHPAPHPHSTSAQRQPWKSPFCSPVWFVGSTSHLRHLDVPHGCFQLRVQIHGDHCPGADRQPRTYSTFSSCTILTLLLTCVYTSRCILTLYFAASVHPYHRESPAWRCCPPSSRAPSSRSGLFTARTKRATKLAVATRRAPRPAASSRGCPHALLSQPGRKACRVPRAAAPTRRSDPACLPCVRLKYSVSQPRREHRPEPDRLHLFPAASLSHGSTPITEHCAPSTEHRALTPRTIRALRQLPIAANRFPAVRGRNESMSTAN